MSTISKKWQWRRKGSYMVLRGKKMSMLTLYRCVNCGHQYTYKSHRPRCGEGSQMWADGGLGTLPDSFWSELWLQVMGCGLTFIKKVERCDNQLMYLEAVDWEDGEIQVGVESLKSGIWRLLSGHTPYPSVNVVQIHTMIGDFLSQKEEPLRPQDLSAKILEDIFRAGLGMPV